LPRGGAKPHPQCASCVSPALNNWSQRLARWFENFAPWIKPPRVPEWILHWHSICGGSLGAAIAQYFFNHKTSKQTFRVVYLKTVGIQITILVTLFFVNQYR
jgi:hypothetical protein